MSFHQTAFLAVVLMAIFTYFSRAFGLLFKDRVRLVRRCKVAFDVLPPAILTALIAPTILGSGPAEAIAGLMTIAAAVRLPLLGTMLVGTTSIVILRAMLTS
jgi:branched chain amino acid efflux pump